MTLARARDIVTRMSSEPSGASSAENPQRVGFVVAGFDGLADGGLEDVFPEAVRHFAETGHLIVQHFPTDLDFPDKRVSRHQAAQPGGAYAKMTCFHACARSSAG